MTRDADTQDIVRLLDGIPRSHERALLGLQRAREGDVIVLDGLERMRTTVLQEAMSSSSETSA
jgi:regulator of RNase E activity RraA